MRKVAFFAAVVCCIFYFSVNALAQNTQPRYVGMTNGVTTGGSGQTWMNQMCIATWGVNAHMCNTDQFFGTAGLKSAAAGRYLWVQPVLHNCVSNGSDILCTEAGSPVLVDQSTNFTSCDAWSTTSSAVKGATVLYDPSTGWTLQTTVTCDTANHVACCAP